MNKIKDYINENKSCLTLTTITILLSIMAYFFQLDFIIITSTAAGAIFGTGLIFILEHLQIRKDLKSENTITLSKTKYTIETIKKVNDSLIQELDKLINKELPVFFEWEKFPRHEPSTTILEFEFQKLSFLLNPKKYESNLLNSIFLVVTEYNLLKNILSTRNNNYEKYLDKTDFCNLTTKEQLKACIGTRLFYDLENGTDLIKKITKELYEDSVKP